MGHKEKPEYLNKGLDGEEELQVVVDQIFNKTEEKSSAKLRNDTLTLI